MPKMRMPRIPSLTIMASQMITTTTTGHIAPTIKYRTITFFIPGTPAPQGSKRALGPGRMIESSKNVGAWRERIAITAHNAMQQVGGQLIAGPIAIYIDLVLPRPKSAPKSYTPPAIKRPDVDKLARACLDAITGTVVRDDAQIIDLHATKRLAGIGEPPGATLEIIELPIRGHP